MDLSKGPQCKSSATYVREKVKNLFTVVSFQEIKKHSTFNPTAYDLKYKNLFTAILLKKN
jgi:hypothetical protein